ncbi:hypothetical protein EOM09_05135 [bacterium]|nr:hypothetical protein [bacterium]
MSNIFNYFDNVILAETLNDKTKSKFEIIENKEDLTNLINTDYSEAFANYKNGNIIYRGARNYFKNANDIAIIITPGIRVSKEIPNLYTILLSEIFDSWKGYPKRNRSHICTYSYSIADGFSAGHAQKKGPSLTYIVFPKNGTKIGVCSEYDIWVSFSNSLDQDASEAVDSVFFLLATVFNDKIDRNIFNDKSETIQLFKDFDQKFNTLDLNEFLAKNKKYKICKEYVKFVKNKQNNSFKDFFGKNKEPISSDILRFLEFNIFSTKGFKLENVNNFNSNKNSEVWFEGPALYIPIGNKNLI